jgi:hypothetical protein
MAGNDKSRIHDEPRSSAASGCGKEKSFSTSRME